MDYNHDGLFEKVTTVMNTLSQRDLETKVANQRHAKLKTAAATIYYNFIAKPSKQALKVWNALKETQKVMRDKAFLHGEGIYADYIFNGDNINYSQVEKDIHELKKLQEQGKIAPTLGFSEAIALHKPQVMQNLLDHGVTFDADTRARKRMHKLINALCPNGIAFANETSKKNLEEAIWLASFEKKKLIILCNHVSHMDAAVLDKFFYQLVVEKLLPKELIPRFLCGAYMYVSPGQRQYTPSFYTTAVIGKNDMDHMLWNMKEHPETVTIHSGENGSRKNIETTRGEQLKKLKEASLSATIKDKKESELSVIFPYAGRGKNGGLKDHIPHGMAPYLTDKECVYSLRNMKDTSQLKPTKYDILRGAHSYFQPYDISVDVERPWIGGEKDLNEIHENIITQRDRMRPQYTNVEKKEAVTKEIIRTQEEIHTLFASREQNYNNVLKPQTTLFEAGEKEYKKNTSIPQEEVDYHNKLVAHYDELLQLSDQLEDPNE